MAERVADPQTVAVVKLLVAARGPRGTRRIWPRGAFRDDCGAWTARVRGGMASITAGSRVTATKRWHQLLHQWPSGTRGLGLRLCTFCAHQNQGCALVGDLVEWTISRRRVCKLLSNKGLCTDGWLAHEERERRDLRIPPSPLSSRWPRSPSGRSRPISSLRRRSISGRCRCAGPIRSDDGSSTAARLTSSCLACPRRVHPPPLDSLGWHACRVPLSAIGSWGSTPGPPSIGSRPLAIGRERTPRLERRRRPGAGPISERDNLNDKP